MNRPLVASAEGLGIGVGLPFGGPDSDPIQTIAGLCASIVELIGIGVITGIVLFVAISGLYGLIRRSDAERTINQVRQRLGKGILLGLEFLIAADIIHTVATDLTFESIGVLALVVLIRTFLSFTLELELHGRWPWQAAPPNPGPTP